MTPKTPSSRLIIPLIWLGCITTLGVLLSVTVPRAVRSYKLVSDAEDSLRATTYNASHITSLRATLADRPAGENAPGGLTPRVIAALHRAGLPDSTLTSISPEAESPLAGQPGLKVTRRRATIVLSGVTLPQFGRFLDAWRSAEPAWIAAGIDLAPAINSASQPGGDQPLRAVISIETTTVHHHGASP